jgi:multidrug efflux pump subunit AcrB
MLEKLVKYCVEKHLLMNFIFIAVVIGGVFAWSHTSKEEFPDITFDRIRISVPYHGAPAEDVELLVTKPIEEKIRGLDGVYRILSTSSSGSANISVEIEQDYPDFDEALTEIRNAVLDARLPVEILDDPSVRVFKTSKKAILDIALIHSGHHLLTDEGRRELQKFSFAFENRLLSLPEVNSVGRRGYLREELQIRVHPAELIKYEIPFNTVMRRIRQNHVRQPAGILKTLKEPKVTILSELDTPAKLQDLIVQGGFDGQVVRLGQIADIDFAYEDGGAIYKVNGHEAIMLNVVKSGSYGILEALAATKTVIDGFRASNLAGTPIRIALLDDESIDLRNRLRIISINAAIGFALILACLFTFLNVRAGLWVAMGIPFTFCCSMIVGSMLGFTINGVTLAAVIIVMGMVVDDAIVVAENITRLLGQGLSRADAAIQGTSFVVLPIIASIATTCVAFVPLFFFSGHYGKFISFIPPVIFLMLGASLLESLFILPGHMAIQFRRRGLGDGAKANRDCDIHWFHKVEERYARFLEFVLHKKLLVLFVFVALLALSGYLVVYRMQFEMFPREETRDIVLTGQTPEGSTRRETAMSVRKIEDVIIPYVGQEVVGIRTGVARSRRGGPVQENNFRIHVEIVSKEERDISAADLMARFEKEIKKLDGFNEVRFAKSRWGQQSGSPIEIIVEQNNNELRSGIVAQLAGKMKELSALENVEIDEGLRVPEYRISIDRDMIKRLSIDPQDIVSTFRAALEGTVLYEFSNGDEDIRVRLTTDDETKRAITNVLALPVENNRNYLVSLGNIVSVTNVVSPNSISRRDLKRTSEVYADIKEGAAKTPLQIAEQLEAEVFPEILSAYPTTGLTFGGEVEDTRESRSDLRNAVIMAVVLIFIILAVLFNSLWKPLVVMLAIPFGMVGIIIAFYLHGKTVYGFYAAIGAIGLAGVVVNDAIIMLVKLDREFSKDKARSGDINKQVATVASTRLRAVILTTLTTVAGVLPTAYGFAGYDAMLADMMLALTWGITFGTAITLLLVPSVFAAIQDLRHRVWRQGGAMS